MRYKTKRQIHIQILPPHEEPTISVLQPPPPPSFQLSDTHTHDRAIAHDTYTGALPSCRPTSFSHRLAHCCTRASPTRAQCCTYCTSTSIGSSHSPPSPSISGISLLSTLPSNLSVTVTIFTRTRTRIVQIQISRTRLDTPELRPPSFLPSFPPTPRLPIPIPFFLTRTTGGTACVERRATQCARTLSQFIGIQVGRYGCKACVNMGISCFFF
ncbi:hypothetical protein B0H13DRAFT_709742 [Mycena leptocephala]|nr:hypothetical protein B0H13DRAFT_709742 [Mycena leptocephala]